MLSLPPTWTPVESPCFCPPAMWSCALTGGGYPPDPSAHGSLLCQDAVGRAVLGWAVAGPGSGLSEEPVWGCEPVALEGESFPRCPPGPVLDVVRASVSICW